MSPLSTQHSLLRSRLREVPLHDIAAVARNAVGVRAGRSHGALLTGLRGAVAAARGCAEILRVPRATGQGLGLTGGLPSQWQWIACVAEILHLRRIARLIGDGLAEARAGAVLVVRILTGGILRLAVPVLLALLPLLALLTLLTLLALLTIVRALLRVLDGVG